MHRTIGAAILLAVLMATIATTQVVVAPNEHSRWRLHPTHPNPTAECVAAGGVPGHEYYLDSNDNGVHDHLPGDPPVGVASEPEHCFRD